MDTPQLTLLEEIRIGIWSRGLGEHVVIPLGRPPTVDDLLLTKLKAEIVDGQLVVIGPTAFGPSRPCTTKPGNRYDTNPEKE